MRRYFGTDGVRGDRRRGPHGRARRAARRGVRALERRSDRARRARHARLRPGARGARSRPASPRAAPTSVLGGILPTPAVALARRRRAAPSYRRRTTRRSTTASSSSAEGWKLSDADEEAIEALLDAPASNGGTVTTADGLAEQYVDAGVRAVRPCARRPARRARLRERRDARGRSRGVPAARSGRDRDRRRARREQHQRGLRRHRSLAAAPGSPARSRSTSASRSTATAIACSPSMPEGSEVDGDQILAILALHLGVDLVAVTTMTNLGFHQLMDERGIRVVTTDVGDRYVLEALRARRSDPRRRAVGSRARSRRPHERRRPGGCAAAVRCAGGDGPDALPRRPRSCRDCPR